jgi:hypothetical protein
MTATSTRPGVPLGPGPGKKKKYAADMRGKILLLNKALSGLSPVKFRVLHKESFENS